MKYIENPDDVQVLPGVPQQQNLPFRDSRLTVAARVDDLLKRMTLPEKIGQMTQLDITLINTTGKQKDVRLDPEKARDMILNHHIGSFLNGEAVSPKTWYAFINELSRIAVEESRLGIPIIYGIDHIHGAGYIQNATIFPQSINIGATFNPDNAYKGGWVTAIEAADLGHHWLFSPVLDLGVNPLWPRVWETYGEDPFMASVMGASYVKGLQNNEEAAPYKVAATGKHFLGYSDPRSGWDRTPAHLSMQQIHEFHRPAFQKAIDAGLKTIMVNSGEINGVPVHASYEILTKLLREEMGFDGVIVTDWDDIGKLVNFHYTAENFKEATFDAIRAGIDMSMTPLSLDFNTSLLELVEEGRIDEERIDASVRRILKLKFDLGLFESPLPRNDRFDRIGKAEHRQLALEAARESIVLLKNENQLLPLKKKIKAGVFGLSANSKRNLSGGWTIGWQGGEESQYPAEMHTIYTALKAEFSDSEITLFDADLIPDSKTASKSKIETFINKLNNLDVLIYAGGEEPYCEFTGNISDLNLPQNQIDEVKLLGKSSSPLVLVLVQGRPRLINDILDEADAILFAGLPGFEGAEAIANCISGKINPSGKMPVSYPMSPNHFLTYNHKRSNLYFFDPSVANHIVQDNLSSSLFPFGYGLSYTTFEYSDLKLSATTLGKSGSIKASVTIKNTGSVAGSESVLWFTSTHFGKITRPTKELKYFEKIHLEPGESAISEFVITPEILSYPDADGNRVLEKTTCSIMAGDKKKEFSILNSFVMKNISE